MKTKLLLFIFFTGLLEVVAQPGTGGDPGGEGGQSAGAPIGGNILYLLAMGAVYGFYKVKNALKKDKD